VRGDEGVHPDRSTAQQICRCFADALPKISRICSNTVVEWHTCYNGQESESQKHAGKRYVSPIAEFPTLQDAAPLFKRVPCSKLKQQCVETRGLDGYRPPPSGTEFASAMAEP